MVHYRTPAHGTIIISCDFVFVSLCFPAIFLVARSPDKVTNRLNNHSVTRSLLSWLSRTAKMYYFKVKEQNSTPVDKIDYFEASKFQMKLVQQCKELPNLEEDMALVLWKSARLELQEELRLFWISGISWIPPLLTYMDTGNQNFSV